MLNGLIFQRLYLILDHIIQRKKRFLKKFMEFYKKKFIINNMEEQFNNYPDLEDKEFNRKIFEKKEFNLSVQTDQEPVIPVDQLQDELCKFSLSSTQQFLSNYINPKTPYNGILLYHGTGVGKTCSSVTIAEGFLREAIEMPFSFY